MLATIVCCFLALPACHGFRDIDEALGGYELWYLELEDFEIRSLRTNGSTSPEVPGVSFSHIAAMSNHRQVAALAWQADRRIVVVSPGLDVLPTDTQSEIGCLSAGSGARHAIAARLEHGFTEVTEEKARENGGWSAAELYRISFGDYPHPIVTQTSWRTRHFYCASFGARAGNVAYTTISTAVENTSLVIETEHGSWRISIDGCNLVPRQFGPSDDQRLLFTAACLDEADHGLYVFEASGEQTGRYEQILVGAAGPASWRPDGRAVAFAMGIPNPDGTAPDDPDVGILMLDSGEVTPVASMASWPIWIKPPEPR